MVLEQQQSSLFSTPAKNLLLSFKHTNREVQIKREEEKGRGERERKNKMYFSALPYTAL